MNLIASVILFILGWLLAALFGLFAGKREDRSITISAFFGSILFMLLAIGLFVQWLT